MPPWVQKWFLNYLPRMVRMKRPDHDQRWNKKAYAFRHHESTKATVTHDSIIGDLYKMGVGENEEGEDGKKYMERKGVCVSFGGLCFMVYIY